MNDQPDKFFREKLQGYQKPVSPEIWIRVVGNLHRKSGRYIWLRVAAAILLLAVAGILLFPFQHEADNKIIAAREAPPEKSKSNEITSTADSAIQPAEGKKEIAAVKPHPGRPYKRKANNNTPLEEKGATYDEPTPAISEESVPMEVPNTPDNAPVTAQNETSVHQAAESNRSVTLVYSADEVNEKYLNKKALAEATSEAKKPSTLRKLLDKAYDLKHNQDPLGELRQKKNEILALNFKSDKQRSQNR